MANDPEALLARALSLNNPGEALALYRENLRNDEKPPLWAHVRDSYFQRFDPGEMAWLLAPLRVQVLSCSTFDPNPVARLLATLCIQVLPCCTSDPNDLEVQGRR